MLRPAAAASVLFLYLMTGGVLQPVASSPVRTCKVLSCERRERLSTYGYNSVKEPVQIDIGTCEEVFEDSEDCETPEQNQVILTHEDAGNSTLGYCPRICEPRSYSRISSSNRDSPFTVDIVKSCYKTRHHCLKGCVRKPSYLYMFPGSKYQQRVDVGKCVGQCSENSTQHECVALRHKAVAVEGPNGYETVQTIAKCACKNTLCYRADHFHSVSEIVFEEKNNSTLQKKRREKLINIGKCVGSCPGVTIPGTCYPSNEQCIFYFNERVAHCVPTGGEKYTYTDLNEKTQTVAVTTECGCASG